MALKEKKIKSIADIGVGAVVAEFYSPSCAFCRAVEPVAEKLSNEISEVEFIKINTHTCPEIASLLGIRSVPTFVAMKNGRETDRLVGARSANELRAFAKKLLVGAL